MSKRYSNPCIRCGRERIVSKTWKEKVGFSIVVNTQTVCPDADCQKKVESNNKKQKDRRIAMKLRSEQRASNRKAINIAKKGTKGSILQT